ncbi:MAG: hypothetical protein JSS18_05230 [Proteobacteria bacterium]|nr:hypothetical protein [Pseudomonadota bacterium]
MDSKAKRPKTGSPSRQIVGFSLPPAVAAEVKMEAARRNLALKDLFGEMWALYKTNTKRSA